MNLTHSFIAVHPLENRQSIRRTRHPTRNIRRLTRHKETPPFNLLTMLPQLLQIKQLTNRHSPTPQHHLMQRIILPRRPGLKSRLIATRRTEIAPQKLHHGLTLLDACERDRLSFTQGLNFRAREFGVSVHVPAADDEDVTEFDLGPLVLGYSLQVLDGNAFGLESVVFSSILQAPFMEIEQDPSSDDALLGPLVDAVHICLLHSIAAVNLVQSNAIVEFGFLLVPEVSETVPLGAALGVEGPDIVIHNPGWFLIDFLMERLPAEEGDVSLCIQWPVEVYADAGVDF
jgi:hypothetical protein